MPISLRFNNIGFIVSHLQHQLIGAKTVEKLYLLFPAQCVCQSIKSVTAYLKCVSISSSGTTIKHNVRFRNIYIIVRVQSVYLKYINLV